MEEQTALMQPWQAQLVSGSIAGMANQLACHPFDVVRTRLQVNAGIAGPLACVRGMVRDEPLRVFYRGLSAPLCAQAVYKAILFSVNGFAQRFLLRSGERPLAFAEVFGCGALSGLVNSIVVTPVELIRNQLISHSYHGPRQVVQHAMSCRFSFVALMYRGWSLTVLRDMLGVGMWFLGFHACSQWLKESLGLEKLDPMHLLLSGSVGGICFWSLALPFDGLKTRVQSMPLTRTVPGLWEIIQSHGRFYRGWQVAFGRGIPGAAITLSTQTLLQDWILAS